MGIQINNNWASQNRRESVGQLDATVQWVQKSSGASKFLQMIQKPLKLVNHLRASMPSFSKDVEKKLGVAVAALNLARFPNVTVDAAKAITKIDQREEGMSTVRKIGRTVSAIFEAISNYCYCILFVKTIPLIGGLAQAVCLAGELIDLPFDISDWKEARNLEAQANGQVKEALAHARKYYMLSVMRDVIAIAGAIFGLALLPSMPLTGLMVMSLAGTVLGVTKDFLKARGAYPLIEFDRGVVLGS